MIVEQWNCSFKWCCCRNLQKRCFSAEGNFSFCKVTRGQMHNSFGTTLYHSLPLHVPLPPSLTLGRLHVCRDDLAREGLDPNQIITAAVKEFKFPSTSHHLFQHLLYLFLNNVYIFPAPAMWSKIKSLCVKGKKWRKSSLDSVENVLLFRTKLLQRPRMIWI